jgi:hypothetical protein
MPPITFFLVVGLMPAGVTSATLIVIASRATEATRRDTTISRFFPFVLPVSGSVASP